MRRKVACPDHEIGGFGRGKDDVPGGTIQMQVRECQNLHISPRSLALISSKSAQASRLAAGLRNR